MNEEEKKAICELKNYISRRKLNYTKLDRHDKSIDNLLNLIEKLQKENEELEENSIPKTKIEDKIKELETLQDNQYIHISYIKKVLKELLESEE